MLKPFKAFKPFKQQPSGDLDPDYVSRHSIGCLRSVIAGLEIFLMGGSILLLAGAAIIFFLQHESISNSERVPGKAQKLNALDTGEKAPIIP